MGLFAGDPTGGGTLLSSQWIVDPLAAATTTGGVYRIEARDAVGTLRTVWSGEDATTCPGVLAVTWPQTPYPVGAIRIHTQIEDWEQIDAVELHGRVCA